MGGALDAQWAALGGFALTVLVQSALVAFTFGRLFERQRNDGVRLTKLEQDGSSEEKAAVEIAKSLIKFESDMRHLVNDVSEIKKGLGWMGRIANIPEHPPG